jgi:hypothetical protein
MFLNPYKELNETITFDDDFKISRKDFPPGKTYRLKTDEHEVWYFICPCGCGGLGGVSIGGDGWKWDGNEEQPTLSPSILLKPCGWHGYLVKGEWKSV